MFFTTAQREDLYSAIPSGLDFVEFGVFKGENAARIAKISSPRSITLVDKWRKQNLSDYPHLAETDFDSLMEYSISYYGGRPDVQETHEKIFNIAKDNLSPYEGIVKFCRMATTEFFSTVDGRKFDVAYVDASHQYEGVLADLKGISKVIRPGGLIFLNDAAVNHRANQQNMGVLQAAVTAIKLYGFSPLVITDNAFADLVLAAPSQESDKGMTIMSNFLNKLEILDHHFVEVPSDLLGSFNHRIPSGFSNRLVSSFSIERAHPSGFVSTQHMENEISARGPQLINSDTRSLGGRMRRLLSHIF